MGSSIRFSGLVALAVVALGCETSNSNQNNGGNSGTACQTNDDCARGTVCRSGACTAVACTSCGTDEICTADPVNAGSMVCTGVECTGSKPCPSGQTCENLLCVAGPGVGPDASGTTGTGGDGTTPGGCTGNDQCAGGKVCNTTTGECVTPSGGGKFGSCTPCTEPSECGDENAVCATLGAGNGRCTVPCKGAADCASGWVCQPLTGADGPKACVPGDFQCGGCLTQGCPDGQICNPHDAKCITKIDQCKNCKQDGECGPGSRCHSKGGATKFCVPECAAGACPENGTCVTRPDGVGVCEWKDGGPVCCLGPACGGGDPCATANCAGSTPYCQAGLCVQCLEASHCTDPAKKICDNGVCVDSGQPPECPAGEFWNAGLTKCCECLNATHCNGNLCDPATCQCTTGGGGQCDVCTDPYPGCAEFNGQFVCVQCTSDEHCPGDSCDVVSYTCKGVPPVVSSGKCQEEGCQTITDANGAQVTLTCDQTNGLCYNASGNCDNITQFCPNGGECKDFLSLFGGAIPGGGIPGGGGTGLPGSCTCTPDGNAIPFVDSQGDCPDGLLCGKGLLGILDLISGGGFGVPETCYDPNSIGI